MSDIYQLGIEAEILGLEKQVKRLQNSFSKTRIGVNLGLDKGSLSGFSKAISGAAGSALVAGISGASAKAAAALNSRLSSTLQGLGKEAASVISQQEGSALKAMSNMGKQMAGQMKSVVSGLYNSDIKGLATGLASSLTNALGKAGKGFNKKVSSWGDGLSKRGQAKGGVGGGAMKGMGGLLKMLGPTVQAMSTIGNLLGPIVTMLFDAERQAVDLNKGLLNAGTAAGDLTMKAGDLRKELGLIRAVSTSQMTRDFGVTSDEIIGVVNAANQAGYSLQKMTKDLKTAGARQEYYTDMTKLAVTYSKALGVSSQEIAAAQGQYMEDLGINLKGVEERFSSITQSAMSSGFSVKRFYGMVQQATSGMTMYNVRVEEAAALLSKMGKIVGSNMAGQMLQQFAQGYRGEGVKERYMKVKGMGGKGKDIARAEADKTAQVFGKKMETGGITGSVSAAVQKASQEFGKNIDMSKLASGDAGDRKALLGELASLNNEQIGRIQASLMTVDEGMAREFGNLADVSKGMSGSTTDVVKSMKDWGVGATMAGKLYEGASFRGGGMIHEAEGFTQEALMEQLGVGAEELGKRQDLSRGLAGQFAELQSRAKEVPEGGFSDEEMANQVEKFGAFVNKNGEIIQGSLKVNAETGERDVQKGREITSQLEFVMAQGDAAEGAFQGDSTAEDYAKATAENTQTLTDLMQKNMVEVLNDIYSVTEGIFTTVGGWIKGILSFVKGILKTLSLGGYKEAGKQYETFKKSQDNIIAEVSKMAVAAEASITTKEAEIAAIDKKLEDGSTSESDKVTLRRQKEFKEQELRVGEEEMSRLKSLKGDMTQTRTADQLMALERQVVGSSPGAELAAKHKIGVQELLHVGEGDGSQGQITLQNNLRNDPEAVAALNTAGQNPEQFAGFNQKMTELTGLGRDDQVSASSLYDALIKKSGVIQGDQGVGGDANFEKMSKTLPKVEEEMLLALDHLKRTGGDLSKMSLDDARAEVGSLQKNQKGYFTDDLPNLMRNMSITGDGGNEDALRQFLQEQVVLFAELKGSGKYTDEEIQNLNLDEKDMGKVLSMAQNAILAPGQSSSLLEGDPKFGNVSRKTEKFYDPESGIDGLRKVAISGGSAATVMGGTLEHRLDQKKAEDAVGERQGIMGEGVKKKGEVIASYMQTVAEGQSLTEKQQQEMAAELKKIDENTGKQTKKVTEGLSDNAKEIVKDREADFLNALLTANREEAIQKSIQAMIDSGELSPDQVKALEKIRGDDSALGTIRSKGLMGHGVTRNAFSSLSPEAASRANFGAMGAPNLPKVNDFIFRVGSNELTGFEINAADEIMGMKPGGAFDKMGASNKGGNTVSFHIHDAYDPQKVVAEVDNYLKRMGII